MIAATASNATACTILFLFMGNAFILGRQWVGQKNLNSVNMIRFSLILTALFFQTGLHAQNNSSSLTTEDSIRAVITSMFDGMKKADSEMVKAAFSSNAIMHAFARNQEGKIVVKEEKPAEFAMVVGQAKAGSLDERIQFEKILIDGPMASVWTPYQFYYEGKFSHCGVNSFQLVRLEGGWKIQYIIDTRRKTGCE